MNYLFSIMLKGNWYEIIQKIIALSHSNLSFAGQGLTHLKFRVVCTCLTFEITILYLL